MTSRHRSRDGARGDGEPAFQPATPWRDLSRWETSWFLMLVHLVLMRLMSNQAGS
jgi:hypothetical protein